MGGGGRREQVDEDEDEAPGPLKITTKGGARKVVQPNGGLAAFGDNRCAEPTLSVTPRVPSELQRARRALYTTGQLHQ